MCLLVTQICTETFGAAPDVVMSSSGAQTVKMPYIPTHLDYMLFELFKNAMRAVVDSHDGRRVMPAIHVAICPAPNSVTLRISDQVAVPSCSCCSFVVGTFMRLSQPCSCHKGAFGGRKDICRC